MAKPEPAYTRLDVDERRRQLLERGAELFSLHAYDELSMAQIAKQAGISKALLYHYFPSKRDFFMATLQEKAAELSVVVEAAGPEPEMQLDAFLVFVEANAVGYVKLVRSAGQPEVAEIVDTVRHATADRILEGLGKEGPAARGAVRAWLAFLDGVILDWLEHRDVTREQVRAVALGALWGAVSAT